MVKLDWEEDALAVRCVREIWTGCLDDEATAFLEAPLSAALGTDPALLDRIAMPARRQRLDGAEKRIADRLTGLVDLLLQGRMHQAPLQCQEILDFRHLIRSAQWSR